MNITLYTYNADGIFTGAKEVDAFGPVPVGTLIPPPDLTPPQVAQWQGASWAVLPEYPPAPAPPPTPVPQAVTMRQARLALLGSGMLTSVNAAIASMPGAQGEAARIEWEFSSEVKRNQPLVLALGPVLGLSATQLDQLFIVAGSL